MVFLLGGECIYANVSTVVNGLFMSSEEKEYLRVLREKNKQRAAFRRFIRGQSTPIKIRDYIGLNYLETKELLKIRMLPTMFWNNYGSHWVVDHLVPFCVFDVHDEKELKLLWHPENLMPMIRKDNTIKQGDCRFSLLILTRRQGYSYERELLIERCEREIKKLEKYIQYNSE